MRTCAVPERSLQPRTDVFAGSKSQRLRPTTARQCLRAPSFPWFGQQPKRDPIRYSSSLSDVPSLDAVGTLWQQCLQLPGLQDPHATTLVQTALRNSFSVRLAIMDAPPAASAPTDPTEPPARPAPRLVGLARTMSDGHHCAQVLDVCVDPAFQRQGIGSKLLRDLVRETLLLGPRSVGVFAASPSQAFFRRAGFKWNPRYRIMRYLHDEDDEAAELDVTDTELEAMFGGRCIP